MELVIKSSESLASYAKNHGNSLSVIPNPKREGHKFFVMGDGTKGAVASALQGEKVDATRPFDYQICHCAKKGDPNGTVVPFLCKVGAGAEAEATFTF